MIEVDSLSRLALAFYMLTGRHVEVIPHLKCDIELDLSGPSHATVNKWTADVPRKLADRIEKDESESGHHPVKDNVGKPVGTIYLDHYGELI